MLPCAETNKQTAPTLWTGLEFSRARATKLPAEGGTPSRLSGSRRDPQLRPRGGDRALFGVASEDWCELRAQACECRGGGRVLGNDWNQDTSRKAQSLAPGSFNFGSHISCWEQCGPS